MKKVLHLWKPIFSISEWILLATCCTVSGKTLTLLGLQDLMWPLPLTIYCEWSSHQLAIRDLLTSAHARWSCSALVGSCFKAQRNFLWQKSVSSLGMSKYFEKHISVPTNGWRANYQGALKKKKKQTSKCLKIRICQNLCFFKKEVRGMAAAGMG